MCFFGLQYLIKRYLLGPVVTQQKIDEAREVSVQITLMHVTRVVCVIMLQVMALVMLSLWPFYNNVLHNGTPFLIPLPDR